MKKILILKPRLDVMFKKGPVPKERGEIAPIREHWKNFVNNLASDHEAKGNNVKVLELPNWQFTPAVVEHYKPDMVYIPHRQFHQFPVDEKYNPRYYMQMVFPWLFQIDPTGWGPDASVYPIQKESGHPDVYDELRERQLQGLSKFDQPAMDHPKNSPKPWLPFSKEAAERKGYLFFPCQIPHDETIKFHSEVSVAEALRTTVEVAKELDKELIIKGHPVNPGSMDELKQIAPPLVGDGKGTHIWADNVNINHLIANADAVVMVNSGVGMESILHGKRVAVFGDADYDSVVCKVSPSTALDKISSLLGSDPDVDSYRTFINTYVTKMYDSRPQYRHN